MSGDAKVLKCFFSKLQALEDGSTIFLWNIGNHLHSDAKSNPRRTEFPNINLHLQHFWMKSYSESCRWTMITAVQIHVRMMLHVSTHKQTITAIVLRTGKERTVACLDCSVAALHVKVESNGILHSERALACFISREGLDKPCHRSQRRKYA
jgi:hypothetical protein